VVPATVSALPTQLAPNVSLEIFSLVHGPSESSAFLITNGATSNSLLLFGDVEPSSISPLSQELNQAIWTRAAEEILQGTLGVIFLECSWRKGRPKEILYGHLSPEYFVEELAILAGIVCEDRGRKGCLSGLQVVIIHCKEDDEFGDSIRGVILDEVKSELRASGGEEWGVEIRVAEQGMRIGEFQLRF
jgi:cAMP phosphodiesterase